MIILDTNVVSELMRLAPAHSVSRWVRGKPATSLYTTAITQAEILVGVMLMPKGKRRDSYEEVAGAILDNEFAGRVMSFDSEAARAFAHIVATRRKLGRPISQPDGQIAAIARSTGCELATRNVRDFEGCGIELLDPWQS
jgi:predicted nucleic acid-binding protein